MEHCACAIRDFYFLFTFLFVAYILSAGHTT